MIEFNGSLFLMLSLGGLILLGAVEVVREVVRNYKCENVNHSNTQNCIGIDLNNPKEDDDYQRYVFNGEKKILYHGGAKQAILDIYYNKRVIVNEVEMGWYLTEHFYLAANYASDPKLDEVGLVISILVDSNLDLVDCNNGVFIASIEDPKQGQYYWFEGIKIIGIYDIYKKKLD